MSKKEIQPTSSLDMSRIYFITLAVNLVVLTFANLFSPMSVVFGTSTLTPAWALFLSMGALSLLIALTLPIFDTIQEELQRGLTPKEWMMGYFIVNFIGLWLVSRFAEQFGFGISAWWVAAIIAFVLDMVQGVAITRFINGKK